MPRGKELEQLPMANLAPSAGNENGKMKRDGLNGISQHDQPEPADVEKENEDMM